MYAALLDPAAIARWRVPDDPALQGPMTLTTVLTDAGDGTDVALRHDGIPDAVSRADNETGTRMALADLARLFER